MKYSEEDMMSLENDLIELRQKYIEAKNSRKIVERELELYRAFIDAGAIKEE